MILLSVSQEPRMPVSPLGLILRLRRFYESLLRKIKTLTKSSALKLPRGAVSFHFQSSHFTAFQNISFLAGLTLIGTSARPRLCTLSYSGKEADVFLNLTFDLRQNSLTKRVISNLTCQSHFVLFDM